MARPVTHLVPREMMYSLLLTRALVPTDMWLEQLETSCFMQSWGQGPGPQTCQAIALSLSHMPQLVSTNCSEDWGLRGYTGWTGVIVQDCGRLQKDNTKLEASLGYNLDPGSRKGKKK